MSLIRTTRCTSPCAWASTVNSIFILVLNIVCTMIYRYHIFNKKSESLITSIIWRQCCWIQTEMDLMLTLDPYRGWSILKVHHSVSPCEDIATTRVPQVVANPSIQASCSFNCPTFWIYFAKEFSFTQCLPLLWKCMNLTFQTFVLGHRSLSSCLRLLWWDSYGMLMKNYLA